MRLDDNGYQRTSWPFVALWLAWVFLLFLVFTTLR